jgi:hypothetical protein
MANLVKHYLNFNETKDLKEAMKNFYLKLREAENLQDIQYILITHLDPKLSDSYANFEFYETL